MKAAILPFAILAGAAAHAGVIDQHNEGALTGGTSIGVVGTAVNQSAAQTITVGVSGRLDHVEMYAYAGGSLSNPLVLQIAAVSGGAPDTGTILATQSVTPSPSGLQWMSFDLSSANLSVTQGEQIALVLSSTQHLDQGEYDAEGSADDYAAGGSFVRSFSDPWMPIANYDLLFRTYVTAGSGGCYANCDGSTSAPVLNVQDFTCFLQKFAASDAYANCDGSTSPPTLNVQDFTCFLQKFAAGCS